MDVEWAEISYLGGQERVVSVCVYILSGVSIYSHGDPGQNGQTHAKLGNTLPDGRRCLL